MLCEPSSPSPSWAVPHRSMGAQHLVSEPVALCDISPFPDGRSSPNSTVKMCLIEEVVRVHANPANGLVRHMVLELNERGTFAEET